MDLSYHWRIFFISTHALTEGDALTRINIYEDKFQLTPSRRATINHDPDAILMHISTHALTEGDF